MAADLKIRLVNSMVGRPQDRGKIERFLESVSQILLPRLPGYAPAGTTPKAELTLAEMIAELEWYLIDEGVSAVPRVLRRLSPISLHRPLLWTTGRR